MSPLKKLKASNYMYQSPVKDGVISASNTPGRAVELDMKISHGKYDEIDAKSLSIFFGPEAKMTKREDLPEYPISDRVMEVLKSATAAEEELRDAVFTNLVDEHTIPFLSSSCSSKETRKNGAKKYSEQNLINVLEAFGEKIGEKREKMRQLMRVSQLPVDITTASLPDLVPLHHRNRGEGYQLQLQLCMGEFKNADNYKEENASSQCLLYLLGLLYWLRTVLGKPVEAVYGFYVCGKRCSDQNGTDYTVGLLKLSAPQYLGDVMKAKRLSITEDVENPFPMQLLIHFLKQGNRWSISPDCPVAKNPIPCLFVLPTTLWSDDSDRTLVVHGSLSIVFRINATGIRQLVNAESPHFKHQSYRRHKTSWQEYWDRILNEIQHTSTTTTTYYLKVRRKVSVWNWMPMDPMEDAWDVLIGLRDLEIKKTYLDRPFVAENFGVLLMNDRGSNLRDREIDFDEALLFSQFSKIMTRAMLLCEHLPHGDVLPHNIVWCDQTKELTLIDIDEGVAKPGDEANDVILKRNNEYGKEGPTSSNWFIALRYPNPLRTKSKLYTQSQLIATFLSLVGQVRNLSQQNVHACNELRDGANKLGDFLYDIDKEPKEGKIKASVRKPMTNLVTASYSKLVKVVQGGTQTDKKDT